MKTLKLSAFILAAALFLGLGATAATAATADDAKGITLDGKSLNLKSCKGTNGCTCTDCKCDKEGMKTCTCEKCSCNSKDGSNTAMKCGAGKCGAAMAPKKEMKCGAGKCGANMKN